MPIQLFQRNPNYLIQILFRLTMNCLDSGAFHIKQPIGELLVLIEELHERDAPRIDGGLGVGRVFVEGEVALRVSALLDEAVVHQIVVMLLDRRPEVALSLAVTEWVVVGRTRRTWLKGGERGRRWRKYRKKI